MEEEEQTNAKLNWPLQGRCKNTAWSRPSRPKTVPPRRCHNQYLLGLLAHAKY